MPCGHPIPIMKGPSFQTLAGGLDGEGEPTQRGEEVDRSNAIATQNIEPTCSCLSLSPECAFRALGLRPRAPHRNLFDTRKESLQDPLQDSFRALGKSWPLVRGADQRGHALRQRRECAAGHVRLRCIVLDAQSETPKSLKPQYLPTRNR